MESGKTMFSINIISTPQLKWHALILGHCVHAAYRHRYSYVEGVAKMVLKAEMKQL